MATGPVEQRNPDATRNLCNLDEQLPDELLWEMMLQAGPVSNVHLPRDKVTGSHQGYGFVEFRSEEDADYALKVMNMVKLFGKPLRVNKASQDRRAVEVGANLILGGLDGDVDEKLLYDTFSAFGTISETPKVMRDPDTGGSKGYGFVSYDSFEASDLAIECMHGQFLCNKQVQVGYAFKRDSKTERHGSLAERLLAAIRRGGGDRELRRRLRDSYWALQWDGEPFATRLATERCDALCRVGAHLVEKISKS